MVDLIEELELKLEQDIDDEETWAVLGDAYLEMGDPRGEIIELELARDRCFSRGKKAAISRKLLSCLNRYHRSLGHDWSRVPPFSRGGYLYSETVESAQDVERVANDSRFRFLKNLEIVARLDDSIHGGFVLDQLNLGMLRDHRLLKSLDVRMRWHPRLLASIFTCKDAAMFESISVEGSPYLTRLDDELLITSISNSQYLHKLRKLSLRRNELFFSSIEALFRNCNFGILEHLDIGGNRFMNPQVIRHLLECRSLRSLVSLGLSEMHINDPVARIIADSEGSRCFTHIDLSWNNISSQGASSLAESKNLSSLKSLNLMGNNIGVRGKRALAGSRYLPDEVREFYAKLVDRHARSVQTRRANSSRRSEVD